MTDAEKIDRLTRELSFTQYELASARELGAKYEAECKAAHAALDPIVSRRDAIDGPLLSLAVRAETAARIVSDLTAERDKANAESTKR